MASPTQAKRHAARIVKRLRKAYPDATCALRHKNAYQLLVATILSAQCTDERVNMVTPDLFRRYPNSAAMADADQDELEQLIKSTGFFRAKSKNLRGCCQKLVAEHGGSVPKNLDALVQLPGVGRKTANVVLGTAFGIPTGVVVDTHVTRVSYRLGLTREKDPIKIERDLMAELPERDWIDFSHLIIQHGRTICKARRPLCEECFLESLCPRLGVAPKDEPD